MDRKIVSLAAAPLLISILFTLTSLMRAQNNKSLPTEQSFSKSDGIAERPRRDERKQTDGAAAETPENSVVASALPGSYVSPSFAEAVERQTQRWDWHLQSTVIVQGYPGLPARYSGLASLPTRGEARETISMDLYSGFRLWKGAEAHFDLLTWQGFGLNDTLGVEAFPNGEAYKAGTSFPRSNIARLFIRQAIGLDNKYQDFLPGDQLTIAGKEDISRITLTIGRFSLKDIFDNNSYANDPRKQFMNWALMANAAWDYPSDALGYTTGAAVEVNRPNWELRYGFFQIDHLRNAWTSEDQLFTWPGYTGAGDGALLRSWGMASEFERRYNINAHPGTVRFLTYLNHGRFGSYQAALSVPGADISQTRAYRARYGLGLNWEQEITKNIGLFSRIGWNDGQSEAWMFTDINHTASLGISVKGQAWHRPEDTFGLAGATSGISRVNRKFLAAGGTGILDGDGALNYGSETLLESYYDFKVSKNFHTAVDYQFIDAPAFNRVRGPVSIFGTRLHLEF